MISDWLGQIHTNVPYIDNSSVLTVGFVMQVFAVVGLTWKLAQINTALEVRLHRLEYDINNLANKLREAIDTQANKLKEAIDTQEKHKKTINTIVNCLHDVDDTDCKIDYL